MNKKKENAKLYFNELRKTIKKCPKGYKLCYDSGKCELYLVPEDSEFVDTPSTGWGSAICISVGGNYTPTKSETDGNTVIVDRGIEINLEAVSNLATIDE